MKGLINMELCPKCNTINNYLDTINGLYVLRCAEYGNVISYYDVEYSKEIKNSSLNKRNREYLFIEKNIEELTMEEMFETIRKYHQYNLYTVNECFCLQILNPEDCGNDDDVTCISQYDGKILRRVLISALKDIAEMNFNKSHDF